MKTLVIGASHKPERYSYRAVKLLQEYDHEVVALGRKARKVEDWEIIDGKPELKNVDTVTLYLSAPNQKDYYDYIPAIQPRRVIFNPGAENRELVKLLREKGIETEEACTLVLLHTGQF
ncbi:MAG: CoA-binding protein [Owenweeksia sp.]